MQFSEHILFDKQEQPILKIYHTSVIAGRRSYREHHHTECEMSCILSGGGIYLVENTEYRFKKNDVFIFNSEESHCITEIENGEPFEMLSIKFEPRILWSDNEFPETNGLLRIFFNRNNTFTNRIDRTNPSTHEIVLRIHNVENEMTEQKFNYQMLVRIQLYTILTLLIRNYGYVSKETEYARYTDVFSRLNETLRYIDDNLEQPLSLDSLARIAMMNKSYFCTVFKKFNGISPWDYILIKRTEKAIRLLKNTNLTKIEIAMKCGFSSHSNFYKIFRKITGKSPGYYSAKQKE